MPNVPRILIQGERGSFHHAAAVQLFGADIEIVPCPSFAAVFARLDDVGVALVAIENSIHGSIHEVYDFLEKSGARIFAETEIAVHQNLIGLPGARSDQIREIYSHPVALRQCQDFLDQNFASTERIEHEDTAASVRFIVERGRSDCAAIAGETAAKFSGAQILARGIEDNPVNFTRFIAVRVGSDSSPISSSTSSPTLLSAPLKPLLPPSGKISIVLTTSHRAGALYHALGVFDRRQINLTKLESRPVIGEKWRYKFYLDFVADIDAGRRVVADLRDLGNDVVWLGDY
jgi:prephenate dehydratase